MNGVAPPESLHAGRWLAATLAALALIWALVIVRYQPPPPLDSNAPPSEFSAGRAMAVLNELLADGKPHPLGSEAQHRLRDELVKRLTVLGARPEVQRAFVCRGAVCAFIENIVARLAPWKDSGGALLLMVHYDSVAAGPGAGDDGSGVAAALEIARAIASSPPLERDVLLVITDGEEDSLVGAQAFFDESPLAKDLVGVVNLDAGGNGGPSTMNVRVGSDGRFVEALRSLARPISNSFLVSFNSSRTIDTDLALAGSAGLSGLNFGFGGDLESYHTPLDTPAHLSTATLQQQGDNALATLRALSAALDDPPLAPRIWFDIFAAHLVSFSRAWARRLSILALLLLVALRRRLRKYDPLHGARHPLALRILAALVPWAAVGGATLTTMALVSALRARGALATSVVLISGSLACACIGIGIAWLAGCSRLPATESWGLRRWLRVLIVPTLLSPVAALMLPDASYVLLVPALAGCVATLALLVHPRPYLFPLPAVAVALATGTCILPILLQPGWEWHPAAFGAGTVLILVALTPLFAAQSPRVAQGLVLIGVLAFAAGAIAALLTPAFSAAFPQWLNVRFFQSEKAAWIISDEHSTREPSGPIPPAVVAALGPKATEGRSVPWQNASGLQTTIPPDPTLASPIFQLFSGAPRHAQLHVAPARGGRTLWVYVRGKRATSAVILGKKVSFLPRVGLGRGNLLTLYGLPADGVTLELEAADDSRIDVAEATSGLPPEAQPVAAARDASTAVPFQQGDDTVVSVRVR